VRVVPDTTVWLSWFARAPEGFPLADGGRARVFLTTIALQELWAGARSAEERSYCERLYELARSGGRLLNSPGAAWILSGQALSLLARRGRGGAAKWRALRNDVLLATTALAHRAAVMTHDRADFDRIAEVLPVRVVSPTGLGR
jgi:predicted nucleic acid-binding protein